MGSLGARIEDGMNCDFRHASQLHLRQAFGGFPESIRSMLRAPRNGVAHPGWLLSARRAGARDALLQNDPSHAETPPRPKPCTDNPVPVILDDATIYSDDDQIEAMPTTFRPGKRVPVDLGAR